MINISDSRRTCIVSVLCAFTLLSCTSEDVPTSQSERWAAYFAGLPEPTLENPLVIGYPQGGDCFVVGDTLSIAFKKSNEFNYSCWGMHLGINTEMVPIGLTTTGNPALESGNPNYSLPEIKHEQYGEINVVKFKIPLKFVSWFDSVSVITNVANIYLGANIADCPGISQPAMSGYFSIAAEKCGTAQ